MKKHRIDHVINQLRFFFSNFLIILNLSSKMSKKYLYASGLKIKDQPKYIFTYSSIQSFLNIITRYIYKRVTTIFLPSYTPK